MSDATSSSPAASVVGFPPLVRYRPAVAITDPSGSPRRPVPWRDVTTIVYRLIMLAGILIATLARFDHHYVPREVFQAEIRAIHLKLDTLLQR